MFKKYFTIFVLSALCAFVTSTLADIENVDPVLEQQQIAFKLVRHAYGKRMGVVATATDDECFDYYYKEQDEIFSEYNKDFNICRADAKAARDKLTAEASEKRDQTIERGDATCRDLKNCEQYVDGLEFFGCYSEASGSNYEELYNLYVDSNDETTNLRVTYQAIQNDENKCTTKAKNKYVASMANCNSNLDKCLNGAPLPTGPTEPTTTSEASSEETDEPESSSTEPTTTTEASSEETDEPESSSTEPTTTTEDSSEETDEPESSSTEPTTTTEASSEETDEPESSSTEPTTTTEDSSEETDEPESSSTEPTTTTEDSSEETDEPEQSSTNAPETESTDEPEPTETTTTEPPPEEDLFSLKTSFNLWNLLKKFRA